MTEPFFPQTKGRVWSPAGGDNGRAVAFLRAKCNSFAIVCGGRDCSPHEIIVGLSKLNGSAVCPRGGVWSMPVVKARYAGFHDISMRLQWGCWMGRLRWPANRASATRASMTFRCGCNGVVGWGACGGLLIGRLRRGLPWHFGAVAKAAGLLFAVSGYFA